MNEHEVIEELREHLELALAQLDAAQRENERLLAKVAGLERRERWPACCRVERRRVNDEPKTEHPGQEYLDAAFGIQERTPTRVRRRSPEGPEVVVVRARPERQPVTQNVRRKPRLGKRSDQHKRDGRF